MYKPLQIKAPQNRIAKNPPLNRPLYLEFAGRLLPACTWNLPSNTE